MELPRFRVDPEDFVVDELLLGEAGKGQETAAQILLRVEKRLVNTHEVARQIARLLALPDREVGFAGRKDRRGVTRQWFSVPSSALTLETARSLDLSSARVLEARYADSKLRLGEIEGNRFRLLIRGVDQGLARMAQESLTRLKSQGLPNRYGRQRFGREGKNLERGLQILRGESRVKDRRGARFLLSAVQAAVFNRVVDLRPVACHELLSGDLAMVHRTGALILVGDPGEETQRLDRFEISATGPIFGTKTRWPRGQPLELEREALESLAIPWGPGLEPPRGHRLPGGRRPLRAELQDPVLETRKEQVELQVTLPSGSYVTTLLEELFPEGIVDGATGEEL